ncbi:mitochondrial carrier domain-containing protein [Globomyces pollinis-pini]|nr:mitochondrial carrier domain-containing protein [Globomyces pollinis-pini]
MVNQIKKNSDPVLNSDKKSLDYVLKSLIAGGIAGCAAKTFVAPLDRVKILFQTSHKAFEGSFKGYFYALNQIKQTQGATALFKGHSATVLRIFPYAGIKFMMYEQYKILVMPTKDKETGARKFVAGSLAGCTAVIVTYPIELIRVRLAFDTNSTAESSLLRTAKSIYDEQPGGRLFSFRLCNFYRGLSPTILGMIPYAGVSFYTYESLKQFFSTYTIFQNDNPPPLLSHQMTLLSGSLSGMLAQTMSYPFELVRRQMQVSSSSSDPLANNSITQTIKNIYSKRGFRGFFVGLGIGYIKVTPMFAISFWTYEYFKGVFKID